MRTRSSWTPVLAVSTLSGLCSASLANLVTRQSCNSSASSIYTTRFPNVTWDNDQWLLTTTNLTQGHYQARVSVANGYHGISVAALGPFFEVDTPVDANAIGGWPLFELRQTFATVGGFFDSQPTTNGSNYPWLYQYGWDSVISGIPHWSGIILDLGNDEYLDASTDSTNITNFSTSLDMQRGLMNWAFTWTTSKGSFDIVYQMFAHKVLINQAFVSLTIQPQNNTNVTIVNVLNGDGAVRTNFTDIGNDGGFIYSAVSPWGTPNVTAYVFAGMSATGAQVMTNHSSWTAPYIGGNQSSMASAMDVSLQAGQNVSFVKYVGIAASDAFPHPRRIAQKAARAAWEKGYNASLQSHVAEWAALFPRTSIDDFTFPENGTLPNDTFVVETAIMAVANPYYLLQNTLSKNATALINATFNDYSISVGGLGSDAYAGQVFWDADVWMHPGLGAAFPYAASGINQYRKKLYPQAQANAQTTYQSSKNTTTLSPNAAVYSWTSGRYGNCTATGPCFDYQYHLNGDILLSMQQQWLATGDMGFLQNDLYPLQDSIATMFSELLQPNGSFWALTNMTDPDEYANMVDNGGYTMPLVASTLESANALRAFFNATPNATWTAQAQSVLYGRNSDANIVLESTGPPQQNGSIVVKQADVVLIPFPLSYFNENYTASDAQADLEYYADKQSPDGPGMTWAIFSIVANEVSTSGCSAYTYQQYSYNPYVRAPWYQFSEQEIDDPSVNGGTHPAFPFLTGHGGANQVVPFGYLGLRYVNDGNLHVDPAPPLQLPNIKHRTIYWQGWPISATSNQTHTAFSRQMPFNPTSGTTPNSTFANASIPVVVGPVSDPQLQTVYQLPPNGVLTVSNRQTYLNLTTPSNIAQCRPVVSSNITYVPGQFPLSAVDGQVSTRWQPSDANQTSSITVELETGYQVTGFEFDWGQNVPYRYSIVFHNDTDPQSSSATTVFSDSNVTTSMPYNATAVLIVQKPVSNTTSVVLNDTSGSAQDTWTAQYATLSIWGNRYNATYNESNMQGQGATVGEFAVLVDGLQGSQSGGSGGKNRRDFRTSNFMRRANAYRDR